MTPRHPVSFDHPIASEITPKGVYEGRRTLLRALAAGAMGSAVASFAVRRAIAAAPGRLPALPFVRSAVAGAMTMDKQTPYDIVTTYNNFYEFSTDKDEPARLAKTLRPRPWTVAVEGAVLKPKVFDLDSLLKLAPMEERIYRLRCVEGWSMVIPWVGFSLSALIKEVQPTGNAKFVEFVTLADKSQMPGLNARVLSWPYVEGLRIDEANHPLTLLAFGLYGEILPNQNGAPVRLVVPWKYGFKSAKSIVKIRFVEQQPVTAWNRSAPQEYGFYSNVNPGVDHPRWSQASERRLGEDGLTRRKRPTEMFNGYGNEVASLYAGMDLKKLY